MIIIVNSDNSSKYSFRIPVIDNSQTCATIKKIIYNVKVMANSSKEEIVRNEDGSYSISVKERAEKDKANKRVVNLLAKEFGVHVSSVKIKNPVSRNKIIEING